MRKNTCRVLDAIWSTMVTLAALAAFVDGADWRNSLAAAAVFGWSIVLTGRGE